MKNVSKKIVVAGAGVVAAVASSASFAQASGVDVTSIVSSINGTIPSVVAVGSAILGVVVAAWAIKTVRGMVNR
ncbi:major capsid protein [Burkholderia sp. MSMB2157WGS]|uniref:major capsid protein n=1 Tax=Burkholderia sp. MSMB2157WGS TaxID=1637928 RepID=UPI000755EE3F|nr:major capsid protein [Burkholderia sp. MSMB2157WGS]KWE52460.1 coat protein [Burkholderia sp. MSMB2157WGS]